MIMRWFALLVALLMTGLFTACSKDDGKLPPIQVASSTQVAASAQVEATPTSSVPTVTPTNVPTATPEPKKLMVDPDSSFTSCRTSREPALRPVFANSRVCIQVATPESAIRGSTWVLLIDFETIAQLNSWVEESGQWLKEQGIDPCFKTQFLIMLNNGPLKDQYHQVSKDPNARFRPSICKAY